MPGRGGRLARRRGRAPRRRYRGRAGRTGVCGTSPTSRRRCRGARVAGSRPTTSTRPLTSARYLAAPTAATTCLSRCDPSARRPRRPRGRGRRRARPRPARSARELRPECDGSPRGAALPAGGGTATSASSSREAPRSRGRANRKRKRRPAREAAELDDRWSDARAGQDVIGVAVLDGAVAGQVHDAVGVLHDPFEPVLGHARP